MAVQSSSVQYAFALDEDGALTHINKALREHSYTCLGCGKRLSPVLGEINAKHFRHLEECCSLETYLHQAAKEAFFRWYQQALNTNSPIVLELERNIVCHNPRLEFLKNKIRPCSRTVPARYDLTKFFDQVDLEKRDRLNGLQPDVMLSESSGTRRCYIEICVTHPCTQNKVDTGIPIVEFNIQSVHDIEMLFGNRISIEDERIAAFNWFPPPKVDLTCSNTCSLGKTEMSTWSLSGTGRLNETIVPLADIDLETNTEINTWPRELGLVEQKNNLKNFLRHVDPKMLHANCIMCSQASSWDNGYLMCNSKAKYVPYTEALQCAAYEVRK